MERLDNSIKRVWKTEQEILDVIDSVCKENGLCYSLMYGTLLGAVRHHGFIPWDDDIDIIMPRHDYEILIEIWNSSAPSENILQNNETNPDFTQSFTKIRKRHTTFLQGEFERGKEYHKGIFIDIFPGDRVAPTRFLQKIQFFACAISLLYSREHTSGSTGLIGLVERLLLKVPQNQRKAYRTLAQKWVEKWNHLESTPFFFPSTIEDTKKRYPANMFKNLKTIEFCGKEYSCVSNPDAILRIDYGDYMTLPPESERTWKHHPIILDFEHDLEELEHE